MVVTISDQTKGTTGQTRIQGVALTGRNRTGHTRPAAGPPATLQMTDDDNRHRRQTTTSKTILAH